MLEITCAVADAWAETPVVWPSEIIPAYSARMRAGRAGKWCRLLWEQSNAGFGLARITHGLCRVGHDDDESIESIERSDELLTRRDLRGINVGEWFGIAAQCQYMIAIHAPGAVTEVGSSEPLALIGAIKLQAKGSKLHRIRHA
jgi:hypothetical protein